MTAAVLPQLQEAKGPGQEAPLQCCLCLWGERR